MKRTQWSLRTVILLCLVVTRLPATATAQTPATGGAEAAQMEELLTTIGKQYVRPITRESLLVAARNGILGSLDPYSKYLEPAEWAELNGTVSGSFAGVGLRLAIDSASATVRVTGVFKNSPALKAGIRVNDVLLEVDGRAVAGRSMDDITSGLRGLSGTTVALTLARPLAKADLRVSVRRAVIPLPTVRGIRRLNSGDWDYMADAKQRIGYVRIEHFAASTPVELDSAIAAVNRAGAVALVLDLRVNRGGLVRAALNVADRFLDSGTVFSFRYRDSTQVIPAEPGMITRLPVALLINGYTQSVAELVAASLQDNRRAVLIGSRSWGKGHGQEMFPMGDGHQGVKITTFAFVRPSGRPMERHFADADSSLGGVWPDSGMTVSLSASAYQLWLDYALTLDALMPVAATPGSAPTPAADSVLDRAVAVLHARASH